MMFRFVFQGNEPVVWRMGSIGQDGGKEIGQRLTDDRSLNKSSEARVREVVGGLRKYLKGKNKQDFVTVDMGEVQEQSMTPTTQAIYWYESVGCPAFH